jgi:hypothetical protein
MKRIGIILPLLLFALATAQAAPQSAKDFLTEIYSHYRGDVDTTAKGIMLDKPADIRRYFAPDLAALIIADDAAAAKRGDVPELDGDPFVDAQDWNITKLAIHMDSETDSKARATVSFENYKKPDVVRLDLVRTSAGWRISDIVWKEGSFRGLYKKK